jgi:branched-chain amino acid transport system ATP-binding protein
MTRLAGVEGWRPLTAAARCCSASRWQIAQGEVATLLGRNGMGKRPPRCARAGPDAPTGGSMRFAGQPHRGAGAATALPAWAWPWCPKGGRCFPNLSVSENLRAFAANRNASREPWTLERVYALFPRLAERSRNMGNQLSGGEQQMLAIGRALSDQPAPAHPRRGHRGAGPADSRGNLALPGRPAPQGQTILVVDKYVQRLVRLADRHTIIERGQVVWQGIPLSRLRRLPPSLESLRDSGRGTPPARRGGPCAVAAGLARACFAVRADD